MKEAFPFPTVRFDKNVIIFGADLSSFVYVDDKKKNILIFDECPTKELDDTTVTA